MNDRAGNNSKVLSPDERLFQAFATHLANVNRIQTFRMTMHDLLLSGESHIHQKTEKSINEELSKSEWHDFPGAKTLNEAPEVRATIMRMVGERSILISRQVIDSAALVFAHTVLDGTLSECCFISFEATPSTWFPFVQRRKVELTAVNALTADELFRQEASAYVRQQTRESMAQRFDLLNKVCVPKLNGAQPITRWVKRDDLEAFDRIRQNVVHTEGFAQDIPDVADQIQFSAMVGICTLVLVGKASGLNADGLFDKTATKNNDLLLKLYSGMIKDFPAVDQALSEITILRERTSQLLAELQAAVKGNAGAAAS